MIGQKWPDLLQAKHHFSSNPYIIKNKLSFEQKSPEMPPISSILNYFHFTVLGCIPYYNYLKETKSKLATSSKLPGFK